MKESQAYHHYTVTYNSDNRWDVILQRQGSVWPKVFPYCMGNVFVMIVLHMVEGFKPSSTTRVGLGFMTTVFSFLVVNRLNICLGRYNQARGYLDTMSQAICKLTQNMAIFSSTATSKEAKEWRLEMCYQAFISFRAAMAVLDYESDQVNVWDLPEINGAELRKIRDTKTKYHKYFQNRHTTFTENMDVPFRLAYMIKKTIQSSKTRLDRVIADARLNKLNDHVDQFINGYNGLCKFYTTPTPFNFIQMAFTLLSIYVLVIPFVMLSTDGRLFSNCFFVFIITYGFLGLEFIATELENPFGNDACDFNNDALAYNSMEDAFIIILDIDGPEYADKLLHRTIRPKHDEKKDA